MKLSSHLLAASLAAIATAKAPVPKICGNGVLHPKSTAELSAMVNCTHTQAYQCVDRNNSPKDDFMTLNSTDNATAYPVCTEAFYDFKVSNTAKFDESLVVPDLVKVNKIYVSGDFPTYLNATSIDFPDLLNVTGQIDIMSAGKVKSLKMPKLEYIAWSLHIDLSAGEGAEAPPAISLTFPSLTTVGAGLYIVGNINAIEFPALSNSELITIESTGDLDCEAFATKVVNSTVRFRSSDQSKDAVVCSSNKGSTKKNLPSAGNDSAGGPSFRANMLLMAIFVSCASLLV
ncbi:hypothetical protein VE03_03439 [Pseudogymnoascus sp. 23342-1-I1]|nr:hypothetical protein VE03_03439 [Pseudogymnoascus sp. 23342-1-I1]